MVSATRRVLVLPSDTGAGHRSVSGALVEAAHARPGGLLELVEIDPLAPLPPALRRRRTAESPSLFDRAIRLYGAATVHVPWLWGWGFHAADNDLGLAAYLALAG